MRGATAWVRAGRPGLLLVAWACGQSDADRARLAALEARVADLEARDAPAPTAAVDPTSGVLIEELTGPRVLGCVATGTSAALSALYAHEARWEVFTDDIREIGWAPEAPCRWFVLTRIVPFTPEGTRVEVESVVVRGEHTGRHFTSDLRDEPREGPRWSPEAVAEAQASGAWLGGG